MATSLCKSHLQYINMCGMTDCSVHFDVVDVCSWPLLDFLLCRNTINHLKYQNGDQTSENKNGDKTAPA